LFSDTAQRTEIVTRYRPDLDPQNMVKTFFYAEYLVKYKNKS